MSLEGADLLAGTLDLIILRLLQGGAANGWDIAQRIPLLSQNGLHVKHGSLYPALYRLEARGWIEATWGASENNRRAKFYTLTAAGRKQLVKERETWQRFADALELILRKA